MSVRGNTGGAANVSAVTGVLPIANGGTNSNAATNNNRVIVSSAGALVEATAITAAKILKSDSNGIPVHFDTASEPSLAEIAHVKGVTSAIQTQLTAKALKPVVTAAALAANFTVTAAYSDADGLGMTSVTGLSVTFTAVLNEPVLLTFRGTAILVTAATTDLYLGYKIGAATAIPVVTAFNQGGNGNHNVSFSTWITGLSAGSTTIEIVASSSGGTDPVIKGTEGTARPHNATLQITQF